MNSQNGIMYDVADCQLPQTFARIRSRSALRRLHVRRSRCMSIMRQNIFFLRGTHTKFISKGSEHRHFVLSESRAFRR